MTILYQEAGFEVSDEPLDAKMTAVGRTVAELPAGSASGDAESRDPAPDEAGGGAHCAEVEEALVRTGSEGP